MTIIIKNIIITLKREVDKYIKTRGCFNHETTSLLW